MKKIILFASAALLLVACSKNSNDEVREFAVDFAKKVSKNQLDSVRIMYPDAANCDSLALSFMEDNIKATETETKGTFTVDFGSGANATIVRSEDGKMVITSSHGLFAYPADFMDFAQKTGQYDPKLTDVENGARMADKGFKPYLIKKHIHNAAKKLKVVGKPQVISQKGEFAMEIEIVCGVTVQSTSDQFISGDDYKVHFSGTWRGEPIKWTEDGKDVPPNSSVTVTTTIGAYNDISRAYVNTTLSEEAHFNKYFQPTGNEYEEYLSSKK